MDSSNQESAGKPETSALPEQASGKASGAGSNKHGGKLSGEFIACAVLFLLSGLSSLIYQVIWTRMLVFIFGSTTFATSTVLSVFMGGLALGSFVAGRHADRMKNPFLWYGILEGIIGLWAVLAPFLFDGAIPIYKWLWQSMHLSVVPFSLARFAVAAAILLPPTACMGATLPLLSRFVTTSLDVVGDRVGTLYAINTLGAVFGAVAAGFFLLPTYGLSTTILIAGGINVALFAFVFLLSKQWKVALPVSSEPDSGTAPKEKVRLPLPVLVTMVSFSLSGAIAMVYEVGWTRTLLMVIGSTTYAFSIMLSTFLIGIFLGSFICARYVDRMKDPVVWFGAMEIFLCFSGLLSLVLFNYLPYWNIVANRQCFENPDAGMLVRFLFSGLIMVPITLGLGAIFPIAVKACTRDLERVGRSVGTLYSVNTLGAIIGAFAAGFIIIPIIGTEKTLILASAANLLLGMAIIVPFSDMRKSIKVFAMLGTFVVAGWSLQSPAVWDPLLLLSSQKERRALSFNTGADLPSFKEWSDLMHNAHDIVFWKDGLCAHVAVLKLKSGKFALMTSGHTDASDDLDMANQALPPAYALLLRPNSPDVCVIGWGSGVMNGYVLQFPVKKMVSVEIEKEVIDASKFFHHVNLKPELDPRCLIEINDGRNYMLATDEKFDLIASQPSNPWQAGVCNLFTKDSFKVCKDRLKPGGIFAMWFQQAEASHENLQRVLSALRSEFPHVLVFQTDKHDVCALASEEKLEIDLDKVGQVLKDPKVAKAMEKFGILKPEDVAAEVIMTGDEVDAVVKDLPPNSDNMNHLEYDVSRTYEHKQFVRENQKWLLEHHGNLWDSVKWPKMTVPEKAEKMAEIGEMALNFWVERGMIWADESIKLHDNAHAHAVLGLGFSELGEYQLALKEMDRAISMSPDDVRFLQGRALVALKAGTMNIARADLEKVLKTEPDNKLARYRLAQTYCKYETEDRTKRAITTMDPASETSDPDKVLKFAEPLLADAAFVKRRPGVLLICGSAFHDKGQNEKADAVLTRYLEAVPQGIYAWRLEAGVLSALGQQREAAYCWHRSFELGAIFGPSMIRRADTLIKAGNYQAATTVLSRALEINPSSIAARQMLGVLIEKGIPEAKQAIENLSRYNPNDKAYLEALAKAQSERQ